VVQNNPYGSLANCWFQPLTHPSGNDVPETPATQAGLQRYVFFQKLQGTRAKILKIAAGKMGNQKKIVNLQPILP